MKKDAVALSEPIAVIGAACRFPGGVNTLDDFWSLLESGTDAVTAVPPDRFCPERFYSANKSLAGSSITLAAGVIPHIKEFDSDFFGISRKEAQNMDPQQRLVLESVWEALEQAHILPSSLRGSDTGVYMGSSNIDNSLQAPDDPAATSPYSMTGSTLSIIANRVSYIFDLHGPSLTVDTACSSSLVAVHLACEALRSGRIPLAIAGGVNILLAPYGFIGFSKARMLSPDGRCKAFDAAGNGYVRSEGVGTVILKPLSRARNDGNNILAVIAGSGVNSDGRTTGIALPDERSQARLLEEVYTRFRLDKTKLAYVEAHGTGTAAGDPVEAASIGAVLGRPLKNLRPLHIGSVKSNIGHLEPAAGMAGLLKALLVLRHRKIPPNLHFHTPNPAIDFAGLNLTVPQQLCPLPDTGGGELASVNSFGFGGSNAHVVLRRPEQSPRRSPPAGRGASLPPFFLSAASGPSLRALAGTYAALVEGNDAAQAYDLAANLAFCRESLAWRAVIQGRDAQDLRARLKAFAESSDTDRAGIRIGAESRARAGTGLFAFSGNGSQWCGMGSQLMQADRNFRDAMEEVDSLFAPLQSWSLMDVFQDPGAHEEAFTVTEKAQPLLFAMQVCLVKALEAKGLRPSAVMGHSIGEIAAAWACGALSLKDAVTVIFFRSSLQAPLRGKGRMAVANLGEEAARRMLIAYGDEIEISAVNTDSSLTFASCNESALRDLVDQCKKQRIAAKMLDIAYPYHTGVMTGIQEELLASLAGITAREPGIPLYSTVSGQALRIAPGPEYWYANLRRPVLFAAAAKAAFSDGFRRYMEIGPSPVLRSYLKEIFRGEADQTFVAPTLHRNNAEAADFNAAWINAWRSGWNLDVKKHFPAPYARRELPPYAWKREYLWPDNTPETRGFLKADRIHPLLGWALPGRAPVYENTLSPADFPWLKDHVAGNGVVYPAAAFIETMLAAAADMLPEGRIELERVALFRPLHLADTAPRVIRLCVDKEDGGVRIESRLFMRPDPWGTYARARILPGGETPPEPDPAFVSPDSFGLPVNRESLYETAARFLLHYGPAFRTVKQAWVRSDIQYPEVLAELCEPHPGSAQGMRIPPTLVDGAMQSLFILLSAQQREETRAYLPVAFEKVILYSCGRPRFAHTRLERVSPRSAVASFRLLDEHGATLLHLKNCRFHRAVWLEREKAASTPYAVELVPLPHPAVVTPLSGISARALATQAGQIIEKAVTATKPDTGLAAHPYLLLELAALSAAHESVLSVCAAPAHKPQYHREIMESGALSPGQELWFNALLERLEQAGLAARADDRWHVEPKGERLRAETLWRTMVSSSPGYLSEAALLAHVFSRHAGILSGELAAGEDSVLPPRLVQSYFTNAAALQPFSAAARRCLESVLRAGNAGQQPNILHLSIDPAAMLPEILPLLDKLPCRYVVAEKDDAAAEEHAQRFGMVPCLRFLPLDPENPGPAHRGTYHLILMAWSLHQYLNSAGLLESCRAMLAPGGVLCILEHAPSAFTDYVLGARPSWWDASPDGKTPVSLLQGAEYWRSMLAQAGFEHVSHAGSKTDARLPAFLLLAEKGKDRETGDAGHCPAQARSHAPEEPDGNRHWLIAAPGPERPGNGLAEKLREQLLAAGHTVDILHCSPASDSEDAAPEDGRWRQALCACRAAAGNRPCGLVFLAGYDNRTDIDAHELFCAQIETSLALAGLARAWEALRVNMSLWVVCGGALADGIPDARPVPSQGGMAGFVRVMKNELRALDTRLIDLHGDEAAAESQLSSLVRELLQPTDEPEVVFAGNMRYVPRLSRITPKTPRTDSYEKPGAALGFDNPGRLQNLYWDSMPLPEPGPDEARVEVSYTGLNFRDVMYCMGMLPEEALENGFSGPGMGLECSGVVRAVGKQVANCAPGDEVVCFTPNGFSTHVLTKASAIARKPANMSFAEAATVPVAFMTAWYALKHLARMQAGESVLIHGAAGGVGLAAIQIASHLDLKVYATAGAAEKHDFLRRLGVTPVFSSRSLAFAEQIREHTGGRGVDAVLNSLAGEAVPAGLSVLRPFGRFLELGKRDFYADSPMRLRPFSNNLSYFGIDVDQLLVYQPALAESLFRELMELFEQRKLVPLPYSVYPAARAVDAFQAMQQARHIGKHVVSLEGADALARAPKAPLKKLRLRGDASYLITGGSGGLGLATAARLARRGARHIILLSRNGLQQEDSRLLVEKMRAEGVQVIDAKADVADAAQLGACLNAHLESLPRLRGIVHAAAALHDGLVTGLSRERMAASLAAKCLGALNLHTFTLDRPLDFFVLYSSAAAPFGNPGQSAYVCANSLLETFGAWRRSRGLPAQVVGWGPIADTGMVTRNAKAGEMLLKVLGISATLSQDALYWLEHCIAADIASSYYFGLDWHSRANLPALDSPRYSRLRPHSSAARASEGPSLERIRALSPKDAVELITSTLLEEISHVLRLPKDALTPDTPLVSQGMDSLMAVELALAVEQKFEVSGYGLALSETTTARSLAASLHPLVTGAAIPAPDNGAAMGMVQSLERKHGVRLSEEDRETVLKSMKDAERA